MKDSTISGQQDPDTRTRILDAAERIARAQGLEALSMRAISAHTGLTAPAAYRHFSGKDEIVQAILERGYRRFSDGLESSRRGLASPEALLEASIRYYMRFWADDRTGFRIMAGRSGAADTLSGDAIEAGSFGDLPALVRSVLAGRVAEHEARRIARWVAVSLYGATVSILSGAPANAAADTGLPDNEIDSFVAFILASVHAAANRGSADSTGKEHNNA